MQIVNEIGFQNVHGNLFGVATGACTETSVFIRPTAWQRIG